MGARFRGVAVVTVVLVVGAFAGSALAQWWQTPIASSMIPRGAEVVRERVRVEVLNGGQRDGMARVATGELRDDGFDVVYFGNNGSLQDSSVVLARTERVEFAREVADALGIRTVLAEPDSNLFLDVTVVLGQEWTPPPDPDEAHALETPWWDLRRYFKRPGRVPSTDERLADPGTNEEGA
jgi:hypothetical protein